MPCLSRRIVLALWASALAGELLRLAAAAPAASSGRRHMHAAWVEPNATQTTNPIDPALVSAVEDLPLDEPPLVSRLCCSSCRVCIMPLTPCSLSLPASWSFPQARTAVGLEPEGVHLTLWGPNAVLVSWQTGG